MDKERLKLIVKNLESLVTALKSEIYSDPDSYKQVKEHLDHISDYDEVFDDDGYPDWFMQSLRNPFTKEYFQLKEEVLSCDFPWYWNETSTGENFSTEMENSPHFGHSVVRRPNNYGDDYKYLFPIVTSNYSDECNQVLSQIFEFNQIRVNCVYRISFNLTLPFSDKPIPAHQDHNFPHANLLIYLNNADGETVCLNDTGKQVHYPSEDGIIIFEGTHYHFLPKKKRRVVLVATFI